MARKKIPYADASTGETVEPSENTGIKLESFIFDVFPKADKLVAFEVRAAPAPFLCLPRPLTRFRPWERCGPFRWSAPPTSRL